MVNTKLTNSSDETSISKLISGDSVFSIPYFQRPYKWKPFRLKQLNKDILDVVDSEESHFLGAVIVHGRKSNPADPSSYDVIDGQQRLTTLILYLCGIVKVLCSCKEFGEAAAVFQKSLILNRSTRLISNFKIHPCKEDRAQLNNVYKTLLDDADFEAELGGAPVKYLPNTGEATGKIRNNYNSGLRFLRDQLEKEGIERIRDIYEAVLDGIRVVQIDVLDPTSGPKIFDALNSRQEPMTIGDLVRNEIFSRVAGEEHNKIEEIDECEWQPFYKNFQVDGHNLFDDYFFPYGLVKNSNIKKSEVYTNLRDSWSSLENPSDIISQLVEFQQAFIDIVLGTNNQNHSKDVASAFMRLTAAGMPSSTYPFLMQLSNAIKHKKISENSGLEILKVVETFLVRRAICGHEPTGLHAVFKRLWHDGGSSINSARVISAIKRHKTVVWPDDKEFKKSVKERPLYGSAITPFFLNQYNLSLGGDVPVNKPWIEHVLPDSMSADWKLHFKDDEHAKLKDTLPNLIPLSQKMNQSLGNKAYHIKRNAFSKDSIYKSARNLAEQYKKWTPVEMEKRAEELATWALERWKP